MKKLIKISVFVSLLFVLQNNILAQSRKELEKKKKQTEEQIKLTQKILNETKSKKNKGLKEVTSISRLIEKREELIETINKEINYVATDIDGKLIEIDSVNEQYEQQKKNYSKAVLRNYKSKKVYNNSLYLFAAKSFNQLFQRMKFSKYLSKAQEKFLEKINDEKIALERKLSELKGLKVSKEYLASNKKEEVKKMEVDKEEKKKYVVSLTGKEEELKKNLEQQKKAKQNLNAQINAIISREIAEAKKKADIARQKKKAETKTNEPKTTKTNEKKPNSQKETDVLPEVKLLSDNFVANKGKLPWPVESGFIADKFGTHAHEKLDQVMIQNNGIDIRTTSNANVRCVHKGTVSAIISIPGMGKAVLVNHGEYYTVYSKLKDIRVSQGEELSLKQVIGSVAEDDEGYSEVHFEVWYNQDKQNPEIWLIRK